MRIIVDRDEDLEAERLSVTRAFIEETKDLTRMMTGTSSKPVYTWVNQKQVQYDQHHKEVVRLLNRALARTQSHADEVSKELEEMKKKYENTDYIATSIRRRLFLNLARKDTRLNTRDRRHIVEGNMVAHCGMFREDLNFVAVENIKGMTAEVFFKIYGVVAKSAASNLEAYGMMNIFYARVKMDLLTSL